MINKIKAILSIIVIIIALLFLGKLYLSFHPKGSGVSASFSSLPAPSAPKKEQAKQIVYNPGLFGSSLPREVKKKAPLPARQIKSVIKITKIPEKNAGKPHKFSGKNVSEPSKISAKAETILLFQDKKGRIYTEKKSNIKAEQIYIAPRPVGIEPQFTLQFAFIPSQSGIYIAPGAAFTFFRIKNLHFGISGAIIKKDRWVIAAGPGGQAAFGRLRLGLWFSLLRKEAAQIYFTAGVKL